MVASVVEDLARSKRASFVSLAWRRLGSREDAEDAAQETLLRMLRSPRDLDGVDAIRFAYRIAANVTIDESRRKHRNDLHYDAASGHDDGESDYFGNMGRCDVYPSHFEAIISPARETERVVLRMLYLDSLTHAEISRALGLPEGTVKSLVHRGYQRIRRHLHG